MTNGNRSDTPPPLPDRVTSGVRTGDTAVFPPLPPPPPPPPPRPAAVGAPASPLEDVVVSQPPQSDASSPEQEKGQVAVRFETLERELRELLDERLRSLAEQQEADISHVQNDLGEMRNDLSGEVSALRNEVGAMASRGEVDGLSGDIGSLRGDIAASRETVEGLKGTDDARRETLDALNKVVHTFIGKLQTFETDLGAIKGDAEETRHELEALRQADTNLNAGQTRLAARVRGIEQALEELKGALRGIREETLPDVRKAAVRAEQAATAAGAKVAELLPRLEYLGELAIEMRNLRSFMDRVAALERWRNRHSGDIAEVAAQVGLNELVEELRGALLPETGE